MQEDISELVARNLASHTTTTSSPLSIPPNILKWPDGPLGWCLASLISEGYWAITFRQEHTNDAHSLLRAVACSIPRDRPSAHASKCIWALATTSTLSSLERPQWICRICSYAPIFRCFYNSLIERHATEMDQHMAMQSAETLSHDHSFKVRLHDLFKDLLTQNRTGDRHSR